MVFFPKQVSFQDSCIKHLNNNVLSNNAQVESGLLLTFRVGLYVKNRP